MQIWRAACCAVSIWVVLACAIGTALAGDIEEFETARAAYAGGDYVRAVLYFEQLVGGDVPQLTTPALITESRKYLGAAYLLLGRREAARTQFELLLRQQPDYILDPLQFPTEVLELFGAVRERLTLEQRDEEARAELQRRLEHAEALSLRLRDFASAPVEVEIPQSRWLAAIPFGVGQFQNGDEPLGWTLLVSETLMALTAISATITHQLYTSAAAQALARLDREAVVSFNESLRVAEVVDWISLGTFVVLALSGVVEAQLNFVANRTILRRRTVPSEFTEIRF